MEEVGLGSCLFEWTRLTRTGDGWYDAGACQGEKTFGALVSGILHCSVSLAFTVKEMELWSEAGSI